MGEYKPFNLEVNGEQYELHPSNCALAMFREKPEIDYLVINGQEEDEVIRVFNYVNLVRWMGGFAVKLAADGEVSYLSTYMTDEDDPENDADTFRNRYGWNPNTVIKDRPYDWEEERWVQVNTKAIDDEWAEMGGEE